MINSIQWANDVRDFARFKKFSTNQFGFSWRSWENIDEIKERKMILEFFKWSRFKHEKNHFKISKIPFSHPYRSSYIYEHNMNEFDYEFLISRFNEN